MKLYWFRVGSKSSMTVVFNGRRMFGHRHADTQTHRGEVLMKTEAETQVKRLHTRERWGWPGMARDYPQPPEAERDMEGFFTRNFGRSTALSKP